MSLSVSARITFFFLFIAFSSYCTAQTVTVLDQETAQPLGFVTITSNDPKIFASTNAKGQVDISSFKNTERIQIRIIGYKTINTAYNELKSQDFTVAMVPTDISLDQVVVSATRWNQSSLNVPTKVTSIKPKDVILQNPQTAADLLETTGQVYIQKSQQGGGSPMIRGFSTNRLLYTVDGVRMNTAIFRSGNLQNVISLDPFAMESAEVLFGPGSIIYGSDAIGGVMAFQTISPQFSTTEKRLITGTAYARYASANEENTGHADVNIGWKKWASVTSISYNHFGDLKMGKHGPDEYLRDFYVSRINGADVKINNNDPRVQVPTGYDQINLMEKIRYRPNDHWDFKYGFHYSSTTSYSRYDRLIQLENDTPRYGQWDYGPQVWMMNNLQVTQRKNSGFYDELTARLTHQYFKESRISRGFNEAIQSTNLENVHALSANIDFNKDLSPSSNLFYGVEVVTNDVASDGSEKDITTGNSSDGPARYPEATWSSYAAYITLQQSLSEKVSIQVGSRYNFFSVHTDFSQNLAYYPFETSESTLNDGSLTGSVGMVFHPRPTWSVSANLSTGFRAPNVDDIGKVFDSEPGSVVVPNTRLEAEYAYNMEMGIAKVFREWLKVDLTSYYTLLDNAMVRRDFVLNGQDSIVYEGVLSQVQAIQNAAVSRVYGLQLGLDAKLPQGFGLSSQFNYQKGEEELDDGTVSPSRHAAPWFGVTRLSYKAKKLELQVYAVYNGDRPYSKMPEEEKGKPHIYASNKEGNPYAPGWYTVNLKSMYRIADFLSVSAGLENITDQRYRPYSSGLVAPGRNFILSGTVKF